MQETIIFTDLDGTLLDAVDYTFTEALAALELVRRRGIPLVLCSSKTREEIEHYRRLLRNAHPFISENGGGIFLPPGYFSAKVSPPGLPVTGVDGYTMIRLGAPYGDLREALSQLRSEGYSVRGFGDMTAEEISALSGLSLDEARMSKNRDFDEPFIHGGPEAEINPLLESILQKGYHYTKGRFFHILGDSDKGRAVRILIDMYRADFAGVRTAALGDSLNDVPMLEEVDLPFVVQKPDGSYDPLIVNSRFERVQGAGPRGWNAAVMRLLSEQLPPRRPR